MTEHRKVSARTPWIFRNLLHGFYLKKVHVRQSYHAPRDIRMYVNGDRMAELYKEPLDQPPRHSALGETNMARKSSHATRDVAQTSAPRHQPIPQKRVRHRPMFVVQEHHASRLHYDFRLEVEGVLKSWAVPKGPPTDPAQKRLAVQVEDHPLAYATFTGTIPAGQYGAGTVTIWDQGTYDNLLADKAVPQTVPEGIAAGHLEFALHGKKLQGPFALIRMHGPRRGKEQWLLIKRQDTFARSADQAGVIAQEHGRINASQAQARTPSSARAPASARQTHLRATGGLYHIHAY